MTSATAALVAVLSCVTPVLGSRDLQQLVTSALSEPLSSASSTVGVASATPSLCYSQISETVCVVNAPAVPAICEALQPGFTFQLVPLADVCVLPIPKDCPFVVQTFQSQLNSTAVASAPPFQLVQCKPAPKFSHSDLAAIQQATKQNGKVLAKAAEEDGAPSPAVSLGPLGRRLAML